MTEPIMPFARGLAADEALEMDEQVHVRIMREADLPVMVALDAKETGRRRETYYAEKIARCIREPRMNTSLVAEVDGIPVGFVIGRLLFGEFGIPSTRAVLDTLGVHPEFRQQGVARSLLAQYRNNMQALRVEAIDTLVDWDRFDLLAFLKSMGFKPSRDVDLVWDLNRYPFAAKSRGITVRDAEEADMRFVTAVDNDVLGQGRHEYFTTELRSAQQHPRRSRFLLAEIDGESAGFLISTLYSGEFGIEVPRGVLDALGVHERYQNQGVTTALLTHLLAWLREQGVAQMETLCRWNEWNLLRFFEYVGFRPSARINLEWRVD